MNQTKSKSHKLVAIFQIALLTTIVFAVVIYATLPTLTIKNKPIDFPQERIELTKKYIKDHYHLDVNSTKIEPKIVVLHWTAINDLNESYQRLKPPTLFSDRKDIVLASQLNVSAHFLVDRDGTTYNLMPVNQMARHTIGLNYNSIGIENVGGEGNVDNLTPDQVHANIELIKLLKTQFPSIKYVIGHHEYRQFETTLLWLEKDANYRTKKYDPGEPFVQKVFSGVKDLNLKRAPKK
jgi:beta-N-acetylhexosaminidase